MGEIGLGNFSPCRHFLLMRLQNALFDELVQVPNRLGKIFITMDCFSIFIHAHINKPKGSVTNAILAIAFLEPKNRLWINIDWSSSKIFLSILKFASFQSASLE